MIYLSGVCMLSPIFFSLPGGQHGCAQEIRSGVPSQAQYTGTTERSLTTKAGDYSNQNQLWCLNFGGYMVYCIHYGF